MGIAGSRQASNVAAAKRLDAAASRAAYNQAGELSAAAELRRRFPGLIVDNTEAQMWARTIAGWEPLPPVPARPRHGRDG